VTNPETVHGPCERCEQTASLTRYVLDHVHWYEPDSYSCHWCVRYPQPLLCVDCTAVDRAEESGRPVSVGEQQVTGWFRRAAELDEQRRAS
jgi:hypothetical protein